jgi:hypothetical protein
MEHLLRFVVGWPRRLRRCRAQRCPAPEKYLLRFALGGLACVLAGAVAQLFGPEYGGLLLSFPAIK